MNGEETGIKATKSKMNELQEKLLQNLNSKMKQKLNYKTSLMQKLYKNNSS